MPIDLVTGGAGYVGASLVRALHAAGRHVRVLDLRALAHAPARIDMRLGSITDPDIVQDAMREVDTVYHLAGIADLWRKDSSLLHHVNTHGTAVVLDAARAARIRRFVFCSSATTLVGRTTPRAASRVDESARFAPSDLFGEYPRAKRAAECLVEAAAQDGFPAVIAIPTEPLGAGDDALTPPTKMMLDFLNGRTPAYIDCMLNFVGTNDLAKGFIAAAEKGQSGQRYLLAGENVSLGDLLQRLQQLTGRAMPKTVLPYALALAVGSIETGLIAPLTGVSPKAPLTGVQLAGRKAMFDPQKAADELGWVAGPIAPALEAFLHWAKKTGRI